jgi:hypothetical protein
MKAQVFRAMIRASSSTGKIQVQTDQVFLEKFKLYLIKLYWKNSSVN